MSQFPNNKSVEFKASEETGPSPHDRQQTIHHKYAREIASQDRAVLLRDLMRQALISSRVSGQERHKQRELNHETGYNGNRKEPSALLFTDARSGQESTHALEVHSMSTDWDPVIQLVYETFKKIMKWHPAGDHVTRP